MGRKVGEKVPLVFPPFEGTFSLPRVSCRGGFSSVVFLRLLRFSCRAFSVMIFSDLLWMDGFNQGALLGKI